MSGASTLSKKDLFRLHLREVEYDFNNLADILDSVLEGREEFLAQMSEENAKLRELVRDMFGYVLFSCSECWLERSDNPKECSSDGCENKLVYRRIRELGIELE